MRGEEEEKERMLVLNKREGMKMEVKEMEAIKGEMIEA